MKSENVNFIRMFFNDSKEFSFKEAAKPIIAIAMLIFAFLGIISAVVWGGRRVALARNKDAEKKANSVGLSVIKNQQPELQKPIINYNQILKDSIDSKNPKAYWPSLGIMGGSISGIFTNIFSNKSLSSKGSDICASFKKITPISIINNFRQMEIKNFGILTPFIPGAINFFLSDNAEDKKEIKKESMKTVIMTSIVFSTNFFLSSISKNFDASGHMMLKMCSIPGLISAPKHAKTTTAKVAIYSLMAMSMVSDAFFMANTAMCFHTPLEIIAGGSVAVGAYAVANYLVNDGVGMIADYAVNFRAYAIAESH